MNSENVYHHFSMLPLWQRMVPVLPPHLRVKFFSIVSAPSVHRSQSHDDLSGNVIGIAGETTAVSSSSVMGYYYSDAALVLIKQYTEVAHKVFKEEAISSGSGTVGAGNGPERSGFESISTGFLGGSKKGQVSSAPQRRWLGFGVLYQLIQDPEKTNSSDWSSKDHPKLGVLSSQQVNLVIDLLLELLTGDFVDEREIVLQRCLGNIQIGSSVAVSMKLSRKILETYPVTKRSWFRYILWL